MIRNPSSFHIELTNICTAKCPFCIRTKRGVLKPDQLFLVDIEKFFTQEVLKNTRSIHICGSWGDPIYAEDFLKIVLFFRRNNIEISVSTNGYNQKKNFWNVLGKMNIKIIFGIDGITQEIHAKHRVGTKLLPIMQNAREFIKFGGRAYWQFIAFQNNEHQIKKANELADTLGFKSFILKRSREYSTDLQEPERAIDYKNSKKINSDFSCVYRDIGRLYINTQGYVLPCCYLSSIEHKNSLLMNEKMNIKNASFEEIKKTALWEKGIGKFRDSEKNLCMHHCSRTGKKRV